MIGTVLTKLCNKCGKEKPHEGFRVCRGYVRGECKECEAEIRRLHYAEDPEKYAAVSRKWAKNNPAKHAAAKREWRKKNPQKQEAYARKANYGITEEEFTQALIKQKGLCAICGGAPVGRKNLSVDHCHKTGKVRALLCGQCNTGLGDFKDSPRLLLLAHAYLLQHS